MSGRTLENLRRRLERAELENLRRAAAELAARVDELERELMEARIEMEHAHTVAEMWHDAWDALQ